MNLSRLLAISRPRYWAYLAGSYLIGFAIASNQVNDFFSLPFAYSFFYFLIPANFFLYGLYDYFDRVPAKKETADNASLLNFLLISLIFTLPLFALVSTHTLVILLCFLTVAVFYNAPPMRFRSMAFFDCASQLIYILPGYFGYMQLTGKSLPFFTILYLACWPAAMYLFSIIPSIDADKKANVTTSATYLGETWSLLVCLVLWLIFAVYVTSLNPFFVVTFIYPSIPLYLLYHTEKSIDTFHYRLPYVNTLAAAVLFGYLYISKFYL